MEEIVAEIIENNVMAINIDLPYVIHAFVSWAPRYLLLVNAGK